MRGLEERVLPLQLWCVITSLPKSEVIISGCHPLVDAIERGDDIGLYRSLMHY